MFQKIHQFQKNKAEMAGLQINSFIGKFVNLWQNGYEASLNFKTSAGKADIILQVGLGEAPPLPHPQVPLHHVPGPSASNTL